MSPNAQATIWGLQQTWGSCKSTVRAPKMQPNTRYAVLVLAVAIFAMTMLAVDVHGASGLLCTYSSSKANV